MNSAPAGVPSALKICARTCGFEIPPASASSVGSV
jgi:hypothetical protein